MGTEIERKFLLRDDTWRAAVQRSTHMIQGYLANTERGSIRVRISGDRASLNIKSMTLGVTRAEFDYAVPLDEARILLQQLCMRPLIEKTRHFVLHDDAVWEIDEFEGENRGLIVAELELRDSAQNFSRPPWLGREVSDDPRYYNVCLVEKPFSTWSSTAS
ncbi:MAG: CYTH domain-containing protein [Gammaproteobacteria bacterium]|nr:CYTH domain-containing protein [Gammaproteobacteria bacterium]